MSTAWSRQIEQRYSVRLAPDVVAWFDDDACWRRRGGGEFSEPIEPAQWLDPEPGLIWPGFMLPDSLPVIGNGYGDWLCARFDRAGEIREVVFWSHAGGDWIPYGRTLAEGLLYDAVRRASGVAPSFAVEPSSPDELVDAADDVDAESHHGVWTHAAWCWGQLRGQEQLGLPDWPGEDAAMLGSWLRRTRLSFPARARDEILAHLDSALKNSTDYRVAEKLGVTWEPEFVSWMFDTRMIPADRRESLSRHFGVSVSDLLRQNWQAAESLALQVMQQRPDLGWAFDIAGWAAERRGEMDRAIGRYRTGLRPSLFADHTVPFRTHWVADGFCKFSAARLHEHRESLPAELRDDPYVQLFLANQSTTLRVRVSQFWLEVARRAEQAGDPAAAYDAYFNAGWDLGLDEMDGYRPILDGLVSSARASGAEGLARIAELHRSRL